MTTIASTGVKCDGCPERIREGEVAYVSSGLVFCAVCAQFQELRDAELRREAKRAHSLWSRLPRQHRQGFSEIDPPCEGVPLWGQIALALSIVLAMVLMFAGLRSIVAFVLRHF